MLLAEGVTYFIRLTKHALSRIVPDTKIHSVWTFIVVICFIWPLMGSRDVANKDVDFAIEYPANEELSYQNGYLTMPKVRRAKVMIYRDMDGNVSPLYSIRLRKYVTSEVFRDETSQVIWRPARVAIIEMPSGRKWLAYMKLNNGIKADYEARKQDFHTFSETHKNAFIHRYLALYGWYIDIAIILFAYLLSIFELRKESRNG